MKRIGIIGLGSIGAGMAQNAVEAGFAVTVYDVRREAVEAAVSKGAAAGDNARFVGENADIVVVIVLNFAQMQQAVFGPEGVLDGMRPGSVLVLSSTISASDARSIALAANAKGVTVLDAPVSGGKSGAEAGRLTFMVGGPKYAFDETRELFDALGNYVVHVSEEVGSGLIVKAVNQIVTHVTVVAIAEGLTFGTKYGIDPDILFEILTRCTANCYMWQDRVPYILKRDFTTRGSLDIQVKDLAICLDMGREMQFPMFLSAAAQQVYLMGQADGLGSEDLGAVVKVYEKYAKLQVEGSGRAAPMHETVPGR